MEGQQVRVSGQVGSCRALLAKTKAVLLQLRAEKRESQRSIASLQSENKKLNGKLKEMLRDSEALGQDKDSMRERLNLLLTQKIEAIRDLERKNAEGQKCIKKLKVENQNLGKSMNESSLGFGKELKDLEEKKAIAENEAQSLRSV